MTREEAIIRLKEGEPFSEIFDRVWDEALNMALKALEQEPKADVLDKIRAEIEQLRLHKAQFLTNDNKVCIDSQAVLDIIDKYKAGDKE